MSFLCVVVLPVVLAAGYLWTRAADQYASTVGFSVIKQEMSSPIEILGGIADFAGVGVSDSDILYEFITSQELVETLDARLGLVEIFAKPEGDPVFVYDPAGTIEDLHDYWGRMVRVTYDDSTGLIEARALAFEPEDARAVTTGIFEESARLVDELSAIAQDDTTEFARQEVERAVERLKGARERMTTFRSVNQIVDPSADLQGQMGLLSTLEGQLAEALISADLLRESTRETDPRITQAERRIVVIEARIAEERMKLGVGQGVGDGGDYATLLAEYERLAVDREFAEQAYIAALATYDQALAEARRKSRYVAAHIKPTLAQSAQFPQRWIMVGLVTFFLLTIWSIAVLAFYSFRDRR
ncbi:MAG: sugar transporter [Silicimonas sp.]|nr:sugar transporter [Silicimonas sp.]NND40632.1 sugar transporter [Silicimonas sp.]NNL74083.1 sugar transporter [Silicimonas sp.]RZW06102.1 MAG: sugar transporter [Paracoccaceae bacterium]